MAHRVAQICGVFFILLVWLATNFAFGPFHAKATEGACEAGLEQRRAELLDLKSQLEREGFTDATRAAILGWRDAFKETAEAIGWGDRLETMAVGTGASALAALLVGTGPVGWGTAALGAAIGLVYVEAKYAIFETGRYQRTDQNSAFFEWILDSVEYGRVRSVDNGDLLDFVEEHSGLLQTLTGVAPPAGQNGLATYLGTYALPLLFFFGSFEEQLPDAFPRYRFVNAEGRYGPGRYSVGYFRRVLGGEIAAAIQLIDEELRAMRGEECVDGSLAPDTAGQEFETARDLGTAGDATSINEWVGSTDREDYYRIQTTRAGWLEVTLARLAADADLFLYAEDGSRLASSSGTGPTEWVGPQLHPGTYYVRVLSFSGGDTEYTLTYALRPTPEDTAGQEFDTARYIGAAATRSIEEWVGATDREDYYQLVTVEAGWLQVSIIGLAADADLFLYAEDRSRIASSTSTGPEESLGPQLPPGTYYVRVFSFSGGDTDYQLQYTLLPTPEDTAGARLEDARDLGGAGGRLLEEWVGATDRSDYYRISVAGGQLSISLEGLTADADLFLYDGNGDRIGSSTAGGVNAESITVDVEPGIYYVQVYSFSGGDTHYTMHY